MNALPSPSDFDAVPIFANDLEAALHARDRGFAILPLIDGEWPVENAVATTDTTIIREWWSPGEPSRCAIGGRLGKDVVALILDGPGRLNDLKALCGLPATAAASREDDLSGYWEPRTIPAFSDSC